MPKRYGIRVVKTFIKFFIIGVVLISMLVISGFSESSFDILWTTYKGLMMLGAIIVFALVQPYMGYTSNRLTFDANEKAEELDRVMAMCGYIKESDSLEVKTYRSKSIAKKLTNQFEETITITTQDKTSTMEGPRSEVVRAYYRLRTYIAE